MANNHNHNQSFVLYCCGSCSFKITRLAFPSTGVVLSRRCRNSRGTTESMGWGERIGNIVEHTGDFGYLITKCFLHTSMEHFISSILTISDTSTAAFRTRRNLSALGLRCSQALVREGRVLVECYWQQGVFVWISNLKIFGSRPAVVSAVIAVDGMSRPTLI